MNIDNTILYTAVLIGLYQLIHDINDLRKKKNIEDIDTNYIIAGVVAGLLWSIHQYRQGSIYFSLYSAIGSLIGLSTLYRIYKERSQYVL